MRRVCVMEWNDEGLRWVEATLHRGAPRIEQKLSFAWPEPMDVARINPSDCVERIRTFVAQHNLSKQNVTLLLPRRVYFLKHTDAASIEQELPSPLHDWLWSHTDGILLALPKMRADQFRQALSDAGLTVKNIQANFVHMPRALENKHPAIVTETGALHTQVTYTRGEMALYSRAIPNDAHVNSALAHTRRYITEKFSEAVDAAQIEAPPYAYAIGAALHALQRPVRSHIQTILTYASAAALGLIILFNHLRSKSAQEIQLISAARAASAQRTIAAISPVDLTCEIAARLPKNIFLKNFHFDQTQRSTDFSGQAPDYTDVAAFVSTLSNSPLFEKVSAQKTILSAPGTATAVEFSVHADVRERATAFVAVKRRINVQQEISALSKEARVQRLLSITTTGEKEARLIRFDWEADEPATLRFLKLIESRGVLGRCVQLELGSRGSATFEANPIRRIDAQKNVSDSNRLMFLKNPPLRRPITPPQRSAPIAVAINKKSAEEITKEETEQKLNEQKIRLQKLVLSGVVNNGREAMAFVNGAMIRVGDTVQDARVASINDKTGEVTLDLAENSQVILRINP